MLISAAAPAAGTAPTNEVTLVWNYPAPADGTNAPDLFVLRSSTNAATPLAAWPVLTNIPAIAGGSFVTNVTLLMDREARFFVLTASNFWGESDFSNVAWTPAPVKAAANLSIRRGR